MKAIAQKFTSLAHNAKITRVIKDYFWVASAQIGLYWSEDDRRLASYRNKHKDQRAFILGNGPSVRLEDLELMKGDGDVVFVANRFHLAYDKLKMRPDYTMCIDLLVLKDHGVEIGAKCGTPFFVAKRVKELESIRTDNMIAMREELTGLKKFSENPDDYYFSPNPIKVIGFGFGVIFPMLQLAVWMGIRQLYLYGIDHTFKLPKDYVKPGVHVTHQGEDNHFIPNYRNPGEKWAPPNPKKTEAAFQCARNYCESQGIEIYNCTRGGRLEVFERKSIDEVLGST